MPQANSMTSIARLTSPRASERTLPCSLVTMAASSAARSTTISRKAKRTLERWASEECRQRGEGV